MLRLCFRKRSSTHGFNKDLSFDGGGLLGYLPLVVSGDGPVIYDPQFSYDKRSTHRRQAVKEPFWHRFGARRTRIRGLFARLTRRLEDWTEHLRRHVSNAAHHPYATVAGTCGVLLLVAAVVMPVSARVLPGSSAASLVIPLAIPPLTREESTAIPRLESDLVLPGDQLEGWDVITVRPQRNFGRYFWPRRFECAGDS